MSETHVTVEPGSHALEITREFDAPAELLLRAHTDPELVPQWFGPARYHTEVDVFEPRDGGRWRMGQWDVSEGDAAMQHWFHGVFHGDPSVEHGIKQTFEYEGVPGEVSFETLTFTEADGKTTLHGVSVFTSVAARDGMVAAGMEGGMNEGYERLDAILADLRAHA